MRFLKRYAMVTTTMLVVLSVAAFTRSSPQKATFDEIDVGRINVVEPNGMYRMVLSNRPRSIGPIYKGKLGAARIEFLDPAGKVTSTLDGRGR